MHSASSQPLSFMCVVVTFVSMMTCNKQASALINAVADVVPTHDGSDPWDVGGSLEIGRDATGSLVVTTGSSVTSIYGFLGSYGEAQGAIEVAGAGSQWNILGTLNVGYLGKGLLNINSGGTVSSMTVEIAAEDLAAHGEVVVKGVGSRLEAFHPRGGGINIGRFGTGKLTIEDGAVVQTLGGVGLAIESNSNGTITVSGPGSQLNCGNDFNIFVLGGAGQGTLNIYDGGSVVTGGWLWMEQSGGQASLSISLSSTSDPLIDVGGDAYLAGSLSVELMQGVSISAGDIFTLIDIGGTQIGSFSNYAQDDLLATFEGIDLRLSYSGGDGNDVVAYAVARPGIRGDTDGDGDVDDADLGIAFSNYTGPQGAAGGKTISDGDTDGDGDVDDSDLANAFSGFTGPLVPSVPEPNAFVVLGLASFALASRRR